MNNSKLSLAVEMMLRTGRMHKSMLDARVREIGIHRTQHRILMRLAKCGALPSQKELADHLDVTPAAVTGALKKIEQDGYIERTLGHDSRFNEVNITEKGKALVEKTRRMFSEADIAMFDGLTEQELDNYISVLEKLQENIKRQSEVYAKK